jgi:hypothetical protein
VFKLNRATYLALCIFVCFLPVLIAYVDTAYPELGLNISIFLGDYYSLVSLLGQLLMTVLTYPAGVIGTIVSYITIFFGILTPTEAFLLTTPLYIAAGYIQWYVVMPKYFKDK